MIARRALGQTGLDVHPLCLGGNVWGWTADEQVSFRILDEYIATGGNFLDTADSYSRWVPGHVGGESETIIGKWLASRGGRDELVITTKVFGHPEHPGLGRANIKAACDASLRRLQTDHIDVYYAHHDDPQVPMEETLQAFSELVDAGKVRLLGASNFSPKRLDQARSISGELGLHSYQLAQDHYNLMERDFEQTLRPVVERYGMVETPYFALASGVLTGKYREHPRDADTARGGTAGRWLREHASDYLHDRGSTILSLLDEVAAAHSCEVATAALAWLAAQPTVGAVIASARALHQLPALLAVADVTLTAEELVTLDDASREAGIMPGSHAV